MWVGLAYLELGVVSVRWVADGDGDLVDVLDLHAQRLGETRQRELGRGVGRVAVQAHLARLRRHQNNVRVARP